jgi:hypothetical protein
VAHANDAVDRLVTATTVTRVTVVSVVAARLKLQTPRGEEEVR